MEEEQSDVLTIGPVVMGLESAGIDSEVIVTTEGGLSITTDTFVTDDYETFISEPVQVTRYEYEMLNRQTNIERFSFISMLLLIVLIFLTARRSRKVTN